MMKLNSCSVSLQTPRWAHFFVIYKCQFKTNKNRTTIADPYVPRSIFPSHLSMGLFFRTFATSAQSRQKVKTQTNMPDKGRRPGPLCKKCVCGCVGPGDALGVARKRRRKEKKLELKHERRTCENRRENAKAAKLRTDSKRMAKPILDMF